jgi:hypothetical protein
MHDIPPRKAGPGTGVVRQLVARPFIRRLRVFAIDPGFMARFETAAVNEVTLLVPWEDLLPGPVGEYLEVVDADDKGNLLHEPVDLDSPEILGQDGLAPSDGDPQFRQQMVYAVGMRTIRSFERALGRLIHWPLSLEQHEDGSGGAETRYQQRLRIHPQSITQASAFFDPQSGHFHFGYFIADQGSPLSGTVVFSSLSQDVIAHELTHPILMGMGIDILGSHPDVMGFHEAFCDLVALFQHFSPSQLLTSQIAATHGKLDERNALGAVGLQFGQALGRPDGLRNALGYTKDEQWHPRRPDPKLYAEITEPHERGDILVAAVFEAFKKVYESRIADLRRIASKGTGLLSAGALHPDLVDRFTGEAVKTARHLLDMCVRALDYLPPVNITFPDYLRAIITADSELYPVDERNYRSAFADAFRAYGITPADVPTLWVDTLVWPGSANRREAVVLAEFMRRLAVERRHWTLPRDRKLLWRELEAWKRRLWSFLRDNAARLPRSWGVDFSKRFDIVSFLPRERAGAPGHLSSQWVIKITQRAGAAPEGDDGEPQRQGVTLLVEAETGLLRYRIRSRLSAHIEKRRFAPAGIARRVSARRRTLPRERRLRVFAFDPSLGIELETAGINEITLNVPWERDRAGADILTPGPVGEYLEIIDRDPASGCFYEPVNLNEPNLLAQNGLSPSESNPQFHQQMVYAVAMRTIQAFERALGRLALWSPRISPEAGTGRGSESFVRRLRIYPHALREANAYYSPAKKAILFGYFPSPLVPGGGGVGHVNVFTCLSHDIIAHEVTHALLDGMHRRFAESSNADVLAFHEAFADIVALFLHFSLPGVLHHQIAMTRGDLASQNRLGELAQQVGQAVGRRGALRSALGDVDEASGAWKPRIPDPLAYQRLREPHDRGSILVAAVFDAFLTIYKAEVADLLRIASEGTGVLPAGHLHPDLVNRLADEAAGAARKILDMCIRALDYCPPVDITFGDYLRAVITADFELDPVGGPRRRLAVAEAFRRHGLVPEGVRTLSLDGLLWRPTSAAPDENEDVLLRVVSRWTASIDLWNLSNDRRILFEQTARHRAALQAYLRRKLAKTPDAISGIRSDLKLEVHSIRPSMRMDWEGRPWFQWVVELTQRVPQFIDPEDGAREAKPDYYVRGGCTLLIDAVTGKVRYTIRKTLDDARIERQRRFILGQAGESLAATYFGNRAVDDEPFAMLHRF